MLRLLETPRRPGAAGTMLKKFLIAAIALLFLGAASLLLVARSLLGSESVRARVEAQLSTLTGQPVRIGSAGASVLPRVAIELGDVTIGEPVAISARRLSVATGLRGLFARRIEDAEVVLSDTTLTLPLPFPLIASSAPVAPGDAPRPASTGSAPERRDASAAPQESGGFTIASVRHIAVRNLEVGVAGKRLRVDLESALSGDRLDVSRLTARSDHTDLHATGTLESLRLLQGAFTVSGKPLDLDELIALAAGAAGSSRAARPSPRSTGAPSGLHLALNVSAPVARLAGHDLSDLTATVEVTPERIRMAPLALGMFGGKFNGTVTLDPSDALPAIKASGSIAGVDVAALAAAGGSQGAITGRLDATIVLTTRGLDSDALLTHVRASADGAVSDGEIPGLDMVRAVVLAFGKPAGAPPPGSGSAFSRLGGTFELVGGTLTSGNLALASRDFDLTGRMTMAVPDGVLNARADVILSEELTRQAGTDLRRYAQENGRVILPARITGTLAEPIVSIDLAAAMGRALENELKRKARSLLDRLFKKGPG